MPVLSATTGASLDLRRLLLYPVPHRKLFQVELVLRAMNGFEMILLLTGAAAGLWSKTAPLALGCGMLLFVIFNVLLASGTRSLLERLLTRARIREAMVLLLIAGLMLPRLLVESGVPLGWARDLVLVGLPGAPWTLAGRLLSGEATLAAVVGLCLWTSAAAVFGIRQFQRGLRYDTVAAQASAPAPDRSPMRQWSERMFRIPGLLLRDPLAALVEKELRSLARTPRFRMVFIMGFTFGLIVWLPVVIGRGASPESSIAQNFLVIVSVYAMTLLGQVTYWNAFGFDRSAAQIYFTAPQPIGRTIAAKNLAVLLFIYVEVSVLVAVAAFFHVGLSAARVAETFLVVTICSLYMLALGNLSSVHFPRGLRPERVSSGGASGRFQAVVFVLYPLALLPVFLAYVARHILGSAAIFAVLLALAAVIGAAFYWIAMESAASAAVRRRERMLNELAQGEGPVSSE
jgi:ABC-2 type transport system permease protein